MKGYVVRKSDGKPLIFGERAEGTKIERLATDEANEFVSVADPRGEELAAAMRPVLDQPQPTLSDVIAVLPEELRIAVQARVDGRKTKSS